MRCINVCLKLYHNDEVSKKTETSVQNKEFFICFTTKYRAGITNFLTELGVSMPGSIDFTCEF